MKKPLPAQTPSLDFGAGSRVGSADYGFHAGLPLNEYARHLRTEHRDRGACSGLRGGITQPSHQCDESESLGGIEALHMSWVGG